MWIDYFKFLVDSFHTPQFIIFISLIIIDIITGIVVTIAKKSNHVEGSKISSRFFITGIYYKIFNIIIYIIGVIFSFFTQQDIIEQFVIYSIISYEIISILENFNIMGAKFPEPLKKFLDIFSKGDGDKD